MNPQQGNNMNQPTYRSPLLSPLTPPAAGGNSGGGGGGGFGRYTNTGNNSIHPYSPSSFRVQQQRTTTTTTTPRWFHPNTSETPNSVATAEGSAVSSEVLWNPHQVHIDLQTACNILLQRQLKCSAKFIAELDIGLDYHHNIVALPEENDEGANDNNNNNNNGVTDQFGDIVSTTISDDLFLPTPESTTSNTTKNNKNNCSTKQQLQCPSLFQYARTLFEMGDYAYAATILSVPSSSNTKSVPGTSNRGIFNTTATTNSVISPTVEIAAATTTTTASSNHYHQSQQHTFPHKPLPNLSTYETYLRSYALYMAGEKQKEEQILEYQSDGQSSITCRNPYISDLLPVLQEAYALNQLDAFGLYIYGTVLVAATTTTGYPVVNNDDNHDIDDDNINKKGRDELRQSSPSAHSVLIQSILQFPYNWSAWLDLASLLVGTSTSTISDSSLSTTTTTIIEQEIEEKVQPILGGHYMYDLFCAHVFVERHNYYDAMLIYEQWMDITMFSAAPYIRSQYAMCCYHMRDFITAKLLLQELHITIPYRLDAMDVYSNVLYVLEDSFALSQLAHVAVLVDKYRAETCCIIGNYYSMKKQRAKAIQHFQRALLLDRTFTSAYTLIGHEYVEWKQTANAMDSYRKAVQISPRDYRAWYGLGQTYELLNMNLHALYYYKQATQLRPYDALMWCALGSTFSQIQRPQDAIKAYERALQQNPQEHFATQKLATLYHNNQRSEDAAQCYMRHLELRYSSIHPNDDPGTFTSKKASPDDNNDATVNRLEMILQGISIEAIEAEAIMYLAIYYHENNDYENAAILCSRLLDYPGPEREQAKGMLRELRARKSKSTIGATSRGTGIHARSKGPIKDRQSMAFMS